MTTTATSVVVTPPVDASTVVLGIETSCDETAAAVVMGGTDVLSSVVASQLDEHARFGGVVPEIASRAHLEALPQVTWQALERAHIDYSRIDAVAATVGPGLVGALLVGVSAAKTTALALGVPFVGVNHLEAHLYAALLDEPNTEFPMLFVLVSGGHTLFVEMTDPHSYRVIGQTIDDAAGEAFDKVAVMLGLPFPGGPALSKLAQQGDPQAIRFPRPLIEDTKRLDFSFSGLKTAVRYRIAGSSQPEHVGVQLDPKERADIAAGFQQSVIDCLVAKSLLALKKTNLSRLCVGGGVAANRSFRDQLAQECSKRQVELVIAKPQWCTDNAAMGALAWEKIRRGQFDSLDLDVQPGLVRPNR